MFDQFLAPFKNGFFVKIINIVFDFLPLWLPIVLFSLFIQTWLRYVRTKWIMEQKTILLEIKLPKEIFKSPAAMEVIISTFAQPSTGNYIDVFLKGRIRQWFSLELVSIGGQVKFFIWTQEKSKNYIESQIYAQYPTVEIHEVPDYSLDVIFEPKKISVFGAQLKLNKADAYPIKTYVDYGLDKSAEEEEKIDPITPVMEYLGSLKAGEQAWIQILIQAHRSEGLKDARIFKKQDWKDAAKKEIKKMVEKEAYVKGAEDKPASFLQLTSTQLETVKAIERSLSKQAFDTMIRVVYLAETEAFNSANVGGLMGSFKQFGSNNLNSFGVGWNVGYDYPWEDFKGIRSLKNQRQIIDAYKRRSFFNIPYRNFHGKPFILTTEELATIFHFPGGVAQTPTFSRIAAKKSEAPFNIPI
ncbi:MAG: hypothetical protein CO184_01780 [Candidatus Zambryskibacteria bacterium CG_4_9_14_3_um_filter_40_16]|uniref:DUF8128 domain-containing protein n=2 Tax=Candidatus Zambryskiibacteriota TaxID=1817925 RepID=A0A2H0K661_9BACT|nr:MAG: hypothetical protein COV95_02545 [Candidatus Zambryskibacteria bacterium CG11_big_fil_rev_8_21_14_0_20_40_24]PJA33524.1 MAG: hypothetical protein CO184_01780 [Candidatus Zambryskibacteria bacterium CG_4_9_14_3_um_filter_40_16]